MRHFSPRPLALARLHAARADLLYSLLGLDEHQLAATAINGDGWTVRDALAHIAHWDAFEAERLALIRDGRLRTIEEVDVDEQNAAWLAQFRALSLDTALAMCLKERNTFLNVIQQAEPDQVEEEITLPFGRIVSIISIIEGQTKHDSNHRAEVVAWRDRTDLTDRAHGPRALLVAALRASRRALRATLACLPAAEHGTRPVIGEWSAQEIVAHLTGWDRYCIDGLREGTHPDTADGVYGVDSFNAASVAQRAEWSWDAVWAEYAETHAELVSRVEGMSGPELEAPFGSDSGTGTYYGWIEGFLKHTLHHSAELRTAIGIAS